jgi:hypothetical protein
MTSTGPHYFTIRQLLGVNNGLAVYRKLAHNMLTLDAAVQTAVDFPVKATYDIFHPDGFKAARVHPDGGVDFEYRSA